MGNTKIKDCVICRKPIDLLNDDYVVITDYHKGEFFMDGYYHNNCYREQITQSLSMKKKMFGFLEKADKMLDNFDEKSGGKEYEIVT